MPIASPEDMWNEESNERSECSTGLARACAGAEPPAELCVVWARSPPRFAPDRVLGELYWDRQPPESTVTVQNFFAFAAFFSCVHAQNLYSSKSALAFAAGKSETHFRRTREKN